MEIILVIIVIGLLLYLFGNSSGKSIGGCYLCGRTGSRYTWTHPEYPGKIFCTKKCLNRFDNNSSLEQNTYSPKNTQSKEKKASSSKNTINKRRVYPSVFDIIGLKYMTRQKCGWCKSGHDARSKYEITTNEFPNQVFYTMDCYKAYAYYYYSNPKEEHKVDKKISLFGTSHHRLIGENETSVEEANIEYPNSSVISGYPKDFIINSLIGKDFSINGKMCTMTHGKGSSQTIWVIKKGMWGEHVIQAYKLRKDELIDLYTQVYE